MHIVDAASSIARRCSCNSSRLRYGTDKAFDRYCPRNDAIWERDGSLPDFSCGRRDPRGDTTRHESGFRRRRQSRRAGYKSDYRNIANVIFLASGCEPSRIGDSVYWLLLGSSWMKDGAVRPVDIPPSRIASAKSPSRWWRILQNRISLKINSENPSRKRIQGF